MQGFGKSGRRIWKRPFYGTDEIADGSVFRYSVVPIFATLPWMRMGCATSLRKISFGRGFLMEVGEQEDCGRAIEIICRKDGRDISTDATHCAVPMDLATSRVHHSQITLAVHNLSYQFESA